MIHGLEVSTSGSQSRFVRASLVDGKVVIGGRDAVSAN